MKVLISSTGNKTSSEFDLRFGRAPWFCIWDDETNKSQFIRNEFSESQGGAGTKAAELVVSHSVKKVISGDFGPKAKELLERFNVQMVILENEKTTVGKIIEKLKG